MQVQVQGGAKCWVSNVYMPPANSLARRGVTEDATCKMVEDVLGVMPSSQVQIICGDFNARLGTYAPKIGDIQLQRAGCDTVVCARAKWMLRACEVQQVHVLTGAPPSGPMPYTFQRDGKASSVDHVLSNEATLKVTYDAALLNGLSDHTLLKTHLPLNGAASSMSSSRGTAAIRVLHKWNEGESVYNYAHSAEVWK